MGEGSLGEDVVSEPVRQLGHRVRGQRRDHEQVGLLEVGYGSVLGGVRASASNVWARTKRSAPRVGSGSTS